MSNLPQFQEEKPWYSEGLKFKCTGCGGCCTGAPGYVWISEEDIQRIADHYQITVQECMKRYVRRVGKRFSLHEHPKTFDCVFLEGKRCKIYDIRPTQCRTFPWWPHCLSSEEAWKNTAMGCEGINGDAPIVSREEIEKQLNIYAFKHPHE